MGKKEGKRKISSEELTSLRNAGWNFRIKTVKGKRYISARKGEAEKGIGPFSEGLWVEIQNLTNQNGGLKEEASPKEKTTNEEREDIRRLFKIMTEDLRVSRGVYMARHCLFKDSENYCEYWQWSEEPPTYSLITELLGETIFRVAGDGATGSRRWTIRAHGYTCAGCPAFVDERMKKLEKEKETK